MPAANSPITHTEFSHALEGCSFDHIAVAVSGGPDSMALLLLLKDYCHVRDICLTALTVDHGLRSESAQEAKQVAAWCRNLGVTHVTLGWNHSGISSALQEQAREARYDLMARWCHENGVQHLFTAHHQGDQIETLIFRLMRGSFIEGLSGMLPASARHGIFIHRPLLSFAKSRLVATLGDHPFITDPTNHNLHYTRNHLRSVLDTLDETMKERLSTLITSFHKIRTALETQLNKNLNFCFQSFDAGYGLLSAEKFCAQPIDMQKSMLSHITHRISGNAEPIRSEKISRLLDEIITPLPGKKITLQGVRFQWLVKEKAWLAMRETARIAAPASLTDTPVLWDGRYLLPVGKPEYSVGALGAHAKKFARELERAGIPKPAWPTICGLFRLETPHSIPHIHHTLDLRYVPAKLLAGERHLAQNQRPPFYGEKARA